MKRYPPLDPPEYVDFRPLPEVMRNYRATLERRPERRAIIRSLKAAQLIRLYEGMVRFRLHDITLKRWVRQGVLSKAWLGTGEEAVTVGSTHALDKGDYVGPMIRNAGACHERGMPVAQMFKAYLATGDQITRGRDLHTGDPERGVIPPTSFMACLVPVFTGIGLAIKQRGEKRVALTWVGDGASRTAAFHEGFNFAAVQQVPLLVILQDNGVALGTPVATHSAGRMEDLHSAYGVAGTTCDGNNVLDVYAATRLMAQRCRTGNGPAILTATTFRMGGHATHDEAEARALFSADEFRRWGERDPIGTFEAFLTENGPSLDGKKRPAAARRDANRRLLEEAEQRVTAEVEAAAEEALNSRRTSMPDPEDAVRGVYAGAKPQEKSGNGRDRPAAPGPKRPSRNGSRRPTRKLDARPKRRLS
jgi:pyruvate dehydrogenase E1 component alpha subunit/2-oxoisovalerate dehydrogenase E1 component alpha subunit